MNDFTQIVNFSTRINDSDSHRLALLDFLLIFSDPNICSAVAFPPLGNSYYVAISVLIIFFKLEEGVPFHPIGFD